MGKDRVSSSRQIRVTEKIRLFEKWVSQVFLPWMASSSLSDLVRMCPLRLVSERSPLCSPRSIRFARSCTASAWNCLRGSAPVIKLNKSKVKISKICLKIPFLIYFPKRFIFWLGIFFGIQLIFRFIGWKIKSGRFERNAWRQVISRIYLWLIPCRFSVHFAIVFIIQNRHFFCGLSFFLPHFLKTAQMIGNPEK